MQDGTALLLAGLLAFAAIVYGVLEIVEATSMIRRRKEMRKELGREVRMGIEKWEEKQL